MTPRRRRATAHSASASDSTQRVVRSAVDPHKGGRESPSVRRVWRACDDRQQRHRHTARVRADTSTARQGVSGRVATTKPSPSRARERRTSRRRGPALATTRHARARTHRAVLRLVGVPVARVDLPCDKLLAPRVGLVAARERFRRAAHDETEVASQSGALERGRAAARASATSFRGEREALLTQHAIVALRTRGSRPRLIPRVQGRHSFTHTLLTQHLRTSTANDTHTTRRRRRARERGRAVVTRLEGASGVGPTS